MPLWIPVAMADGAIFGAVEPGEVEQADSAVETRTVTMAQPTAAGLATATVPWAKMRTFMKPPYMPVGRPYR